ncbi:MULTISPECIES: DUF2306 domain-containing protein [unclassified Bradyrhizobium]|uniref:DUF2306 domain-containing protein n=1 Tax=unclassified Bradyrhizobium TaxID=2631580 RepID=UPI002916299C|nr:MULTISPECIES: DUF2306 domain-containing protein [unclassified Bradyrhizobium]
MAVSVLPDSPQGRSTPLVRLPAIPLLIWLLRAIALALLLAASLDGFAAMMAGIAYYKGAGNPEIAAKRIALLNAAEAGQAVDTPSKVEEYAGSTVALVGSVSSSTYAYGKESIAEHLLVYNVMSKEKAAMLMVHSLLGGVCMLFGGLQFWPAFRRRFPKWHRISGGIYIVVLQGTMITAMIHLVRTSVADTLDHLFFYVGLWGLALGISFSLWMAVHALWRKQIANHQVWMCISYGLLLSTPIQRYGWLLFGALDPGIRFTEANYAVTGVLIPLSLTVGYLVFTINRWVQPVRRAESASMTAASEKRARLARNLALVSFPALVAAAAIVVQYYMVTPALEQAFSARELVPAGVIHLHDTVIASDVVSRATFALATLVGLLSGAHLLWIAFVRRQPDGVLVASSWALAFSGAVAGIVLMYWGLRMGMPSFATLAGGSMHMIGGAATLLFAVLLAFALRRGEVAWVKEWGVFVLACIAATPTFYFLLPLMGASGFDAQWAREGHIFRLALAGQWLVAIMGAFIYAAYGQATQSRLAR